MPPLATVSSRRANITSDALKKPTKAGSEAIAKKSGSARSPAKRSPKRSNAAAAANSKSRARSNAHAELSATALSGLVNAALLPPAEEVLVLAHAHRRLLWLARQPEVSKFSERVHAELDSGRLSLNDDANMLLDFGLQDRIGALLSACYEKLWLIPALAAVSRRPPSTDPEEMLAQFCAGGTDGQGIFGSASTLRGAAAAAARRGCVERIVRLIALLDVGASRVLLPTHPALLCADSPCRSTERLLQQLWRLVGAKEGDVVIHLRRLGLDLRHSQPKHAAKVPF